MNDIVAVKKRKRGRPSLTENEKAKRLLQKEEERHDKKVKKWNLPKDAEKRQRSIRISIIYQYYKTTFLCFKNNLII